MLHAGRGISLFPAYRTRFQRDLSTAEQHFQQDFAAWQEAEQSRNARVEELRQKHQEALSRHWQEVEERHRDIEEEKDVLSQLDSRPNLMDMTPAEFEALVANLFSKMGLGTKLTRTNRDGGVDAVAFDTRPILGGKVVIQAKRYSHTVGVSAVRDLYGTMMNEGANKGILVTTSSYGPDAYDFCKDKPVELMDGSGLLYHLQQVGYEARIIFPEDKAAAN